MPPNSFPRGHSHSLRRLGFKFPVEIFAFFLLRRPTQQCWQHVNDINVFQCFNSGQVPGPGQKVPKGEMRLLSLPASILPGHRAIMGTRIPPLCKSPLMPLSGPELWKKFGSTPPSLCWPLSLVKITSVYLSMPKLFTIARGRDSPWRKLD